jgi:disease resistance protein RPM1
MQEDGKMKKFVKGAQYIKIFDEIADEIVQIEEEIKHVKDLMKWSLSAELMSPNTPSDIERQISGGCLPEFIKDEDLVGVEENRRKLTGWLYSNEPHGTVITVSGMGGLGKTTLVKNVYDREKGNFPNHAWIVVSQTYDVEELLRTLLMKVAYREQSPAANMNKMDVYELTDKIKKMLEDSKCLIVLDDVWDHEAYTMMRNAFQNLQDKPHCHHDKEGRCGSSCILKISP